MEKRNVPSFVQVETNVPRNKAPHVRITGYLRQNITRVDLQHQIRRLRQGLLDDLNDDSLRSESMAQCCDLQEKVYQPCWPCSRFRSAACAVRLALQPAIVTEPKSQSIAHGASAHDDRLGHTFRPLSCLVQ